MRAIDSVGCVCICWECVWIVQGLSWVRIMDFPADAEVESVRRAIAVFDWTRKVERRSVKMNGEFTGGTFSCCYANTRMHLFCSRLSCLPLLFFLLPLQHHSEFLSHLFLRMIVSFLVQMGLYQMQMFLVILTLWFVLFMFDICKCNSQVWHFHNSEVTVWKVLYNVVKYI